MLVVGAGVAGLALAGFLRRAGLDPVVVTGGATAPTAPTLLAPASLALLDRLGVDAAAAGTRVGRLRWRAPGGEWYEREGGESEAPALVAGEWLRRRLRAPVAGHVRTGTVTAVSVDRGSLRVGFADGVRERFDLVVGADGPRSGLRSLVDAGEPSGPRLHDWSFRTGGEADGPTEVWGRDALATVVPDGDGAVCRVTAAPDAVDDAGPDALASVAERLGWRLPALVAGAEAVDYERRRHADGGTRIAGRVAFCGAAAHPLAPASGVVAPLALGDARVLADELRFGPDDLADVLGGYGRRRQRRIADLRHAAGVVGEGAYPPPGTGASLSAVGRLRSVALRSVLDA